MRSSLTLAAEATGPSPALPRLLGRARAAGGRAGARPPHERARRGRRASSAYRGPAASRDVGAGGRRRLAGAPRQACTRDRASRRDRRRSPARRVRPGLRRCRRGNRRAVVVELGARVHPPGRDLRERDRTDGRDPSGATTVSGRPRRRTVATSLTRPFPPSLPSGSALPSVPGRTYVRRRMERQFELESLRRSLAMLRPGAPALDREEAMRLVRELQALERQVRLMREGLVRLLEETA